MRRWINAVSVAALLLPALAHSADAVAPVPAPLPAASRPAGPQAPGSPAVQAAENARSDPGGATQPEPKAIPQVSVPLRRSAEPADATLSVGPSGQGGIDDDAARCSAKKTKRERAACRKALAAPPKNPASVTR